MMRLVEKHVRMSGHSGTRNKGQSLELPRSGGMIIDMCDLIIKIDKTINIKIYIIMYIVTIAGKMQ